MNLKTVCRLVFWLCLISQAKAEVIFETNFDSQLVGSYTRQELNVDWDTPRWNNGVDEGRVAVVAGDDAFDGNSLAVSYPADLFGSKETGAQWQLDFDKSYEAAKVEYRIKFGEGFDFVRGGKLPGLAGGAANTGGNTPNGSDGFTTRMHWRTDGSAGSRTSPARANINQYIYHPDQPTQFGEDFRWDDSGTWKVFESDRWYHVEHRLEMNTPGEHDGKFIAWLDGEKVLDVDDLRFRDSERLGIDKFYFSTFFGGSGTQWATSKDEVVFFDDFKITVPSPCVAVVNGDINADGHTDFADFLLLSNDFGNSRTDLFDDLVADTNCDDEVNFTDFLVLSGHFGSTSQARAVPEPSASAAQLCVVLLSPWFASRKRRVSSARRTAG